ncbi:phospholipase A [Bizionia myxarmorum]|uniref:Phosphatidylcholine 1-acylhydrolase n=1 Tax=Bizionia myxarmorum TaxID=291186 RepID=A0A5D0R3N2_9FLAO|nr:phospholipase A [Bizionia myxarmorum]TYB76167.1 phospholipase A [Bizionia myxarmorum]
MKYPLLIILLIGTYIFNSNLQAQTQTQEEIQNGIQEIPAFSIHKDNYFITGIPTNKDIESKTADAKYQISFKQMVTRDALPWETYLFITYTQKSFWNIYEFSSPFQEINFNPSAGLAKFIYDKDKHVKGLATLMFNHNSNGRDSIFSRSWNSLNLKYATALNPKTLITAEIWAPFGYKEDNPDLFDYIGITEITVAHDFIPNKLLLEVSARKGLEWNLQGSLRSRLYYNPFNSKNQYIMLEWYLGNGESLVNYSQFESMVRIGYVIKTGELDFLKPKIK